MKNKRIHHELHQDVGLWGAIMMGLGSILGTGVFVSSKNCWSLDAVLIKHRGLVNCSKRKVES